jgi:hypothetical protein
MTVKRNRRKQTVSSDETLKTAANQAHPAARSPPQGVAREHPLKKARHAEAASRVNGWLTVARAAVTPMSVPGRREACLEQARIFREMAEADPLNRNYWASEARKWLERAATPVGNVVVTVEATPVST